MTEDFFQGYKGRALEVLKKFNVRVWGQADIETDRGLFKGTVLPRSENNDDLHIVIKIESGYNIGIDIATIISMTETGYNKANYKIPEKEFPYSDDKPNVKLFGTGGTIASRLDYRTGAVIPAFSPGELGVRAIVPVESRRSVLKLAGERAGRRVAHWQGVAAAACEQCGRNQVPLVAPLARLEQWLARPAPDALRLVLAPGAALTLRELPLREMSRQPQIQLLIGAEGGLDPQEIIAAEQAGFQAVRLGPRVLRTETAGLAALAALQAMWGDW